MADKLQGGVKAGSSSVSLSFSLQKTDFTPGTGKVAADMTISYWRQGGVRVAVAAVDLAAVNSAYAAGGVKEVDAANMAGEYRGDWPDAAFAFGADWVEVAVQVAGCFLYHERLGLPLSTPFDVTIYVQDNVVESVHGVSQILSFINDAIFSEGFGLEAISDRVPEELSTAGNMKADVRAINNTPLNGTGAPPTKWGPA